MYEMPRHRTLLYFADAFAWSYLEGSPASTPYWRTQLPLTPLLGYSSTMIPCIQTGKTPAESGIWTEYVLEPRTPSALARAAAGAPITRTAANLARLATFRVTRKLGLDVEHRLRMPLEISHLFARHPIRYDRFPAVDISGAPTIADVVAEKGGTFRFVFLPKGLPTGSTSSSVLGDEVSDVTFIYDPALDAYGHKRGADPEAHFPYIGRIQRFVESFAASAARQGEEAETLLFSDHGMTTVTAGLDIRPLLRGLQLGRDYAVFMDATFARFWYWSDRVRSAVRSRAVASGSCAWLTAEEQRQYGLVFPDDRYGMDILVADEGVVFHPNYFAPRFIRSAKYPDRGTHGYRPECASSKGVVLYRGDRWVVATEQQCIPIQDIFSIASRVAVGDDRVVK